jgi:hypothetical protein
MKNSSFAPTKKEAKVRLVGSLTLNINGTIVKLSDSFRVQTDLAYTGMSVAEQNTAMSAVNAALAGKAEITFTAELVAEEVRTAGAKGSQAPSAIDALLAGLTSPVDSAAIVDSAVREDAAVAIATEAALDILGATTLPASFGVQS